MKRARIAAALWGGFLFLLTSWPNPPSISAGGFPLDKLTHFLLYAVEAFLLDRAIAWKGSRPHTGARALVVVGVLAVCGMVDEVHQEWIPRRKMDAADLFADVGGAASGSLAAGLVRGLSARRERGRPDR